MAKLQLSTKTYNNIFPFILTIAYQKKGDFRQMVGELLIEYPELMPLYVSFEEDQRAAMAFVYKHEASSQIFLFCTDNLGLDILVHECVHITAAVFHTVGSNINDETEEWFAYLNEFVFREVYAVLTKDFKHKLKMAIE
jgi:hypothetical protein